MKNMEHRKYLEWGVSVIPLQPNKKSKGKWGKYQSELMSVDVADKVFNGCLGIVCGKGSGNLEVIDIDCKYDLRGTLAKNYGELVGKDLMKKLIIQTTVNKGFHCIYRCEEVGGNKKLASRAATEEEAKSGERVKVLIETRGEGGYIAAYPTKGYKIAQGGFDNIPEISIDERKRLFDSARALNEYFDDPEQPVRVPPHMHNGLSPLDDYNERGDVLGLMEKSGWKSVGTMGSSLLLRRPGKTEGHSASWTPDKNWLYVYSTSTEFEAEKAYLPYAIYAVLECQGDFKEATKKLGDAGYGDSLPPSPPPPNFNEVIPSEHITTGDREYVNSRRTGQLEMGLSMGFPGADKWIRFKRSNFVVINGHDGVGKSVFVWYLGVLSAVMHGWKWIIYSGENSSGYVKVKLIEFYTGTQIAKMSESEMNAAYDWVGEHFVIIKNDELYNYEDILRISEAILEEKKYDALLIDPYNSLDINMRGVESRLSTHDYHYKATSNFRLFTKKHKCSVYLNCHAVTEALRRTYPKEHEHAGQPMPPMKADTEGGGKFSNRADDFMTVHRMAQSENEWMWTQIHVRKVKETETGGRPTPLDSPIKIRLDYECRFVSEDGFDPIKTFKTDVPF